jgi:hypothetical protein
MAMGLCLAPLVAEGASICLSQWREVLGQNAEVKTPILDAVADGAQETRRSMWESIDFYFHHLPWDPRIVLSVGAIVMLVGMVMLKL